MAWIVMELSTTRDTTHRHMGLCQQWLIGVCPEIVDLPWFTQTFTFIGTIIMLTQYPVFKQTHIIIETHAVSFHVMPAMQLLDAPKTYWLLDIIGCPFDSSELSSNWVLINCGQFRMAKMDPSDWSTHGYGRVISYPESWVRSTVFFFAGSLIYKDQGSTESC